MALCRGHNVFPSTVRPFHNFQKQPVQNLILPPGFTQVLLYSDSSSRISLVARYTSFLLVSIIPLIISDAILPIDDEARRFWSAVFYALYSMLIYPILTALGVWGTCLQAREILDVPFPNALSLQGPGYASYCLQASLGDVDMDSSISI
jgi:hypothetical protein